VAGEVAAVACVVEFGVVLGVGVRMSISGSSGYGVLVALSCHA